MRRASSVTPARILQTCGCKLWLKAKYQVAENSWSCAGSLLQGANVALCSGDVNKVYIDSPWAWLDFLTQQISFLSVLEGSHGEKHTLWNSLCVYPRNRKGMWWGDIPLQIFECLSCEGYMLWIKMYSARQIRGQRHNEEDFTDYLSWINIFASHYNFQYNIVCWQV